MILWQILAYISIVICYFGGLAVLFGWIKFGIDQKKSKINNVSK